MQKIDGKYIKVLMTTEELFEIERIAKKRKMKKAAVHRMMLDAGIHAHKDMERVGIIQLFDLFSYIKEASKSYSQEYEEALPHQLELPL